MWLIPAFFALHNAEEALALRRELPLLLGALPLPFARFVARLTFPEIAQALVTISVVAFVVAVVAVSRPKSSAALWLLLTLEVAVGINALAHVASAALVFHGYGPGLATAVLINGPFALYCMRCAYRDDWLSRTALRATLPAAIVLHGPVLVGGMWLAARMGA